MKNDLPKIALGAWAWGNDGTFILSAALFIGSIAAASDTDTTVTL